MLCHLPEGATSAVVVTIAGGHAGAGASARRPIIPCATQRANCNASCGLSRLAPTLRLEGQLPPASAHTSHASVHATYRLRRLCRHLCPMTCFPISVSNPSSQAKPFPISKVGRITHHDFGRSDCNCGHHFSAQVVWLHVLVVKCDRRSLAAKWQPKSPKRMSQQPHSK